MTRQPSIPKAALWMAGWLTLMLVVGVAGRETLRELNVFQVMEVRSLIGFLMLYPLVSANGGFGAMRTARPLKHVARNLVHYGAQICWFYALTLIPMAQVVSIEFTMPVWTAIVLGIIGVIVIVRPATGAVNPGQMVALAAALGFGISIVLMKSLTRTEGTVAIIFWMLVIQSAAGFVPALYTWQWPSPYVWGWIVVIAFCGTFSHFCMARAMLYADATVVVPMDFLRVPLTALLGWLIYSEAIDLFTALGAMLILSGNLLNLRPASPAPIRVGA